ncbi:SAM-dependent methyltransferase [Streptomyces mirabilis]|uniref:SAM-dependent methyltransferase n=1 Tax=Streptomyces mirabilis TaxID=68239 RepID=UPI0036980FA7
MGESRGPLGEPGHLNTGVAHNARVWNYWIGGRDNHPVDQAVGEQVATMFPVIRAVARADRDFLGRAVRFLAGERGIRQFLDVGTGLPTLDNTHDIAQRIAPEPRIVYVDNDPVVLAHARALLTIVRIMATLPSGSCLALTHPTTDLGGEGNVVAMRFWNENATPPITARGRAEITAFFEGLDLLDPGLVSCAQWRARPRAGAVLPQCGAVAVKP